MKWRDAVTCQPELVVIVPGMVFDRNLQLCSHEVMLAKGKGKTTVREVMQAQSYVRS